MADLLACRGAASPADARWKQTTTSWVLGGRERARKKGERAWRAAFPTPHRPPKPWSARSRPTISLQDAPGGAVTASDAAEER